MCAQERRLKTHIAIATKYAAIPPSRATAEAKATNGAQKCHTLCVAPFPGRACVPGRAARAPGPLLAGTDPQNPAAWWPHNRWGPSLLPTRSAAPTANCLSLKLPCPGHSRGPAVPGRWRQRSGLVGRPEAARGQRPCLPGQPNGRQPARQRPLHVSLTRFMHGCHSRCACSFLWLHVTSPPLSGHILLSEPLADAHLKRTVCHPA